MFRIKCNGCGRLLPFTAADSGRPAACESCGHRFVLPEVTVRQETPAAPVPSRPAHWPLLILIPLLMAATAAATWVALANTRKSANVRYWTEQAPRVIALKSEAERLAIAGKLDESHARYRELEQIVAAKPIHDSALWDIAERAKADQDRIYDLLLTKQANDEATRRQAVSAAGNTDLPQRPYPPTMQLARIEPPSTQETSPPIAPATHPVVATTRPATLPIAVQTPAVLPASQPAPRLPATRPIALKPDGVTDAQIRMAMQRSANWLADQFLGDQIKLPDRPKDAYFEGLNALCTYALIEAGRVLPDERLQPAHPFTRGILDRLSEQLMMPDASPTSPVTYAKSLRVAALAVHNRPQDRAVLEADALWLMRASRDGAYTYHDQVGRFDLDGGVLPPRFYIEPWRNLTLLHNGERPVPVRPRPANAMKHFVLKSSPGTIGSQRPWDYKRDAFDPPDLPWDNSNTQFALFGVWCAAEVGAPIPYEYWLAAEDHWLRCQLPTGMWGYDNKQPVGYWAMTLAGINSLLATHEYLDAFELGAAVGQDPYYPALQVSLAWLNRNGLAINSPPVHYLGYNLFSLSRFGMHAGQKFLSGRDWYRELAAKVLADQWPNGAWGRAQDGADALVDTAFILLFLARGQQPVMFNKLMFNGQWNNRGRDVANLARAAAREWERPLRWQVVPSTREWTDWLDSPVLFIASHQTPTLTDAEFVRLRAFVDAGGMLVTHADNGATAFSSFTGALIRRIFPGQILAPLPRNHAVWSLQYKLQPSQFDLKAITNGARVQLLHIGSDVASAWQLRDGERRANFELGANLFAYAAGKPDLRASVALSVPPEVPDQAQYTVAVARIRYDGAWDPEPFAWTRFSRQFRLDTSWAIALDEMQAMDLSPSRATLAHLTGAAAVQFNDVQAAALREYVEGGGVLLVDACGGSAAFADSAAELLARAFPAGRLQPIPRDHPIVAPLGPPQVRPATPPRFGQESPLHLLPAGRGMVFFSRLDLTEGLLNAPAWEISGYNPAYAQNLVQRLIRWSVERARSR